MCSYSIVHEGTRYTLVDTPGFNDTFESDDAITENILKWLESSYRSGTKLNGILYLHSIAAPRMAGSAFDNLCMFRKLCGDKALSHVVLATTFWGTSDTALEEQRDNTLRRDKNLWGRMVDSGSTLVRLEDTRTSALKALRSIASASKVMLQSQHEMINEGKAPKETSAAKFTASCSGDAQFNEYRQSMGRRRKEMKQREEKLKEMKAQMHAQDESLAQLKQQAEKERAKLKTKSQNYYKTHPCHCGLVGRAKCARCRRSIKGIFYRKFHSTSITLFRI